MRVRDDLELANASDAGCVRLGNEDYFLYYEPQDDSEFARRGRLIVITDGMGGRNAGEVASRAAAEVIRDLYLHEDSDDPREVLIAGFRAAHQAITELGAEHPEMQGMGTTCCAAILRNGFLHYGHVGDSRIYLIRDKQPKQLTADHSLVANLLRDGLITAEEAERHPKRNVLTAALGIDSDFLSADFPVEALQLIEGDVVLMSTDGLHGLVSAQEIALTISDLTLAQACRELVSKAKSRGGPDNITVQMMRIKQATE